MSKTISGDVTVEVEWSFKSGSPRHVFRSTDSYSGFTRYDIIACAVSLFYAIMRDDFGVESSELAISVLSVSKPSPRGGKEIL